MNQETKNTIVAIAENRKARHNYTVEDTLECGIVLVGTEVKSLRDGRVNFSDSYALLKSGELFLIGFTIEPFQHGTHLNHERDRTRKLLAHQKEIRKLAKETKEKGLTLVPLKIYFKNGCVKVLLGVAKGKSKVDKRDSIKEREANRDVSRVLRRGGGR